MTPSTGTKDQTVFDELFAPLENVVNDIAATCEANLTPKKLKLYPFVRNLIYHFVMGIGSLGLLVTHLKSSPDTQKLNLLPVGKSTLHEAFLRFPVWVFHQIFVTTLGSIPYMAIPEIAALGTICLIDASLFPAIATMEWAQYSANFSAFKLHFCFELNRMVPTTFLIERGNASERAAFLKMLQSRVTYVADRGYVCFSLYEQIVQRGASFIIRQRNNLQYRVTAVLPINLPLSVSHLFFDVIDCRVRLDNDSTQRTYRLIGLTIRKHRFLLLTNRMDLTTFDVMVLYAYRWQVELVFRFLKRTLGGLHLLNLTQRGITIQFYLLLPAALLQLRFKQRCLIRGEPKATMNVSGDFHNVAHFFSQLGKQLKRYWKLSIHWLTALRNLIAQPFHERTIETLNAT